MRSRSRLACAALAPAALALALALAAPAALRAQESATGDSAKVAPPADTSSTGDTAVSAPPPVPLPRLPLPDQWKLRTGLSASVLYGNREQRILGTRADLSRSDSTLELRADVQLSYGEASSEREARAVFKRLWLGNLTADMRPYAPVSPFVFATVESNLEKRIQGRYSVGLGAKQTLARSATTEASVSVGLLGEQLVPRADVQGQVNTTALTRWSFRGKLKQALGERARMLHTTFWRPDVHRASEFLVQSQTDVEFRATSQVALTVSLLHNYDSEATGRGARTNTDGQMLVGATATW